MKLYSSSLSRLLELITSLSDLMREREDEGRKLLKGVVPLLIVGVAAHIGRHYWTSVASRRKAEGT